MTHPAERGPSGTGHDEVYDCREGDCECDRQGLAPDADCPYDGFPADPPVAVPGPASEEPENERRDTGVYPCFAPCGQPACQKLGCIRVYNARHGGFVV